MKIIYLIFFTILLSSAFAQPKHAEKIKITFAKVDKAIKLDELLDIEIHNCHVISYHFTTNLGNTVKSFDVTGDEITSTIKLIIKELKAGEKFVFENVKYDCVSAPPFKTNFTYIIK